MVKNLLTIILTFFGCAWLFVVTNGNNKKQKTPLNSGVLVINGYYEWLMVFFVTHLWEKQNNKYKQMI